MIDINGFEILHEIANNSLKRNEELLTDLSYYGELMNVMCEFLLRIVNIDQMPVEALREAAHV